MVVVIAVTNVISTGLSVRAVRTPTAESYQTEHTHARTVTTHIHARMHASSLRHILYVWPMECKKKLKAGTLVVPVLSLTSSKQTAVAKNYRGPWTKYTVRNDSLDVHSTLKDPVVTRLGVSQWRCSLLDWESQLYGMRQAELLVSGFLHLETRDLICTRQNQRDALYVHL